jgi:thiamine-monophosphate kinase
MPGKQKPTEKELIRDFARMIGTSRAPSKGVVVGVGDDTAVLRPPPGEDLLVTTDVLVEGRHFERAWLTGRALGWRLAAVNLSDIAAMGGRPRYGVLSLALPRNLSAAYVRGIERGVRDHLAAHDAVIVGGNVSGIESTLVCDLTLVGTCARDKAWRRTCRPDRDAVVVAGFIGDSRAGLGLLRRNPRAAGALVRAYKKPVPRLDVSRLLAEDPAVHGAIDVSDGLSTDLIRVCEGSAAGCEIDTGALPVSAALERYCRRTGSDPVSMALRGGEDYALILAVDAKHAVRVTDRITTVLGVPSRVIGRFTSRSGKYVLNRGGRRSTFSPEGWDHFARGA